MEKPGVIMSRTQTITITETRLSFKDFFSMKSPFRLSTTGRAMAHRLQQGHDGMTLMEGRFRAFDHQMAILLASRNLEIVPALEITLWDTTYDLSFDTSAC